MLDRSSLYKDGFPNFVRVFFILLENLLEIGVLVGELAFGEVLDKVVAVERFNAGANLSEDKTARSCGRNSKRRDIPSPVSFEQFGFAVVLGHLFRGLVGSISYCLPYLCVEEFGLHALKGYHFALKV